jgi:hypothetical protein
MAAFNRPVTLLALSISTLVLFAQPALASQDPACSNGTANDQEQASPVPELTNPVTFESGSPADTINLGGSRDSGSTDITVGATPALPPTVTPDQITLEVPKRFRRIGEKINSRFADPPTFSTPRILQEGTLIAFSMCVDANELDAGAYVGQIIVGGPPGVQSTNVAVTVNAKNATLFVWGSILAALAAFLLLLFRSANESFNADKSTSGRGLKAGRATLTTLGDLLGFWAPTVIAIGAAVVAMAQVYDGDVAWGANWISSFLALAGTAISAAGLGTFLAAIKPGGSGGSGQEEEDAGGSDDPASPPPNGTTGTPATPPAPAPATPPAGASGTPPAGASGAGGTSPPTQPGTPPTAD